MYHHGSEELKQRVVTPCVKGEKVCCLAITEPTAGSDVANLKTSAKLEGDHYILNGEKKLSKGKQGSDSAWSGGCCTVCHRSCHKLFCLFSKEVDHKRNLCRLFHSGLPNRKAGGGWNQLAAC